MDEKDEKERKGGREGRGKTWREGMKQVWPNLKTYLNPMVIDLHDS